MRDDALDLGRTPSDPALIQSLAPGHPAVGLDGVLTDGPGGRMRAVPPMAPGVRKAWRWNLRDEQTRRWWPQGIAAGDHDGVPIVLVSWYAQPRRGISMGARITVVDLRDESRPHYRHVLLVSPRRDGGEVVLDPVAVHAGGLAWSGDRLLVAATFAGFLEFRLSDILAAPPRRSRRAVPFGYRHVLPVSAVHRPRHPRADNRMRYSFLSVESGGMTDAPGGEDLRLVAGEYGAADGLRLARLHLAADGAIVDDTHSPGVSHMQGGALHDGTWYVSASRGDRHRGDLWTGKAGSLVRHAGVLPPGPEDLAVWAGRDDLWSVSEYPGRRWLYSITEYR